MDGDDYSFGDDQPKNNPRKDDRLGVAPFAARLANVVIRMNIPSGYVVGLHGKWGSGKTTAVNFVLQYIKEHNETSDDARKIQHIEFRPWIVSGHQDLMSAFFKLLSEQLGTREGRAKRFWTAGISKAAGASDALVDAAATLALAVDPTGAFAGLAGTLAKKSLRSVLGTYLETPSLQKAYDDLKQKLAAVDRRFLVTIDDIDRLDDGEIRVIMQMVKTIGRLPNVLYILVYDREIVWQALDERKDRIGPKFSEKIVQQEIEIPVPSKSALLGMLDEEIKFLTEPAEYSGRWQHIVRDGISRWINSPRDVLRFSNALKFSWPALEGEFDPQDLVAIEGFRLFEAEAFDWIRSNRDFLFNDGRYFMGAEEERKANVAALKASIPAAKRDIVIELMTVMFPGQAKWLEGDRSVFGESNIAVQNRRGLASEAGYDAYFSLRPSADAVPKRSLDDIVESLEDEATLSLIFRSFLDRTNSRGRSMIGLLLQDLRLRLDGQPRPLPTFALLSTLISIGDEVLGIAWSGEVFSVEPRGHLLFLITEILREVVKKNAGEYLIRSFERWDSIPVLAAIYVDRGGELGILSTGNSDRAVITEEDFAILGEILLPKILRGAKDGSLERSSFYWNIVRAWKNLNGIEAVRTWVTDGVERSGPFTAKIVKGMVSQSFSGVQVHYTYHNNPDEEVYDTEVIYSNAKRHLEEVPSLEEDDRALLEAVVAGLDRVRAGRSADPNVDGNQ